MNLKIELKNKQDYIEQALHQYLPRIYPYKVFCLNP